MKLHSKIAKTFIQGLSSNRLSVFLFHKIPTKNDWLTPGELHLTAFERTLDYIAQHFKIIPLSEAAALIAANKLPQRAACVTFDDGYANWLEGPVAVLLRKNIHATFFITTGQLLGVPMWHERIIQCVRNAKIGEIIIENSGLPPLPVKTREERIHAAAVLENHLKYQALEYRDELLGLLESMTESRPEDLPVLSAQHLREIDRHGFGIGAHTVNHPILRLCNKESAHYEIGAAKEQLEGIIRNRVEGFAYTNGRPHADYSSMTVRQVKAAGYRYAVTTAWGVADLTTSPYQIPRFTPWGPDLFRMQVQILRNLRTRAPYTAE